MGVFCRKLRTDGGQTSDLLGGGYRSLIVYIYTYKKRANQKRYAAGQVEPEQRAPGLGKLSEMAKQIPVWYPITVLPKQIS